MISFRQKGDFSKTTAFLKHAVGASQVSNLDQYGQRGVDALSSATPMESGETSNSWYYKIKRTKNGATISWYNSHVENGVPIAIILQYGHGTRNGGYVQGRDYINPAMQPLFDEMAKSAWREVTKQ